MTEAVLFDMDGTLILSNEAHARAWVEALARNGRQIELEHVRKLMGMGGDLLVPTVCPDLQKKPDAVQEISEYQKALYIRQYAEQARPAPGARDLIMKLRDMGRRVMIATSSSQEELRLALKAAHLADLDLDAVTGDEAQTSKPAPDVVALAVKRLGLEPKRVVMVGDSPFDIEAAGKVGVGVIAVRCGGFTDAELRGAVGVYDDPAALANADSRVW